MDDQTLPPKGGWVMLKKELPTEIQPPLLSIWYAMPDRLFPKDWHLGGLDQFTNLSDQDLVPLWRYRYGNRNLLPSEMERAQELDKEGVELDQRVQIYTPWGQVCLEPYEWTPVRDITPYFEEVGKGMILHEYGETQKTSSRMEEQIFYMQTRGLDRVSAYRLLLGQVRKPNTVWLETHPDLVAYFFGPRPKRKHTLKTPMKVEIRVDSGNELT
jgi:hypothetical protein